MRCDAVERLARSIERDGQIVPLIVVGEGACGSAGEGDERLVLVDGYRRVAALRRLGRDRASVERWACDLAEAVLGVLAHAQSRSFAAIEEALLLRELTQGLGVSQREVARRCGRDGSWVNRRLHLLSGLTEAAIAAVREGRLSSWAAARVIAPLARANSAHADRLLRAHSDARLTTRELKQWFAHYQKVRRSVRERMLDHPRLFLKALNGECGAEIERAFVCWPGRGVRSRSLAHQ
jgi:ParB-like chromosome segregation protein Spo0J